MPRPLRIEYEGAIYQVMSRGKTVDRSTHSYREQAITWDRQSSTLLVA